MQITITSAPLDNNALAIKQEDNVTAIGCKKSPSRYGNSDSVLREYKQLSLLLWKLCDLFKEKGMVMPVYHMELNDATMNSQG